MRLRSALMLIAGVAMVVLATNDAMGQAREARVRGKITDEWGNGLEGVQITADSAADGHARSASTDDKGEYTMVGLSSVMYEFAFTLDGYQGIRTAADIHGTFYNRPIDIELEALPSGGRLRGEQEFDADGGSPKIKFKEDGIFEFEDADGEEGEGTYGIVELSALLVVRDYDGDNDKYSVTQPVVVTFASDQFTSLTWDGVTLNRGVPQDDASAVRRYRLAAEQGNADAQFNLGTMYDNGQGVPQDYAEAVRLYRLAADQGNAIGQFNLGVMYEHGQGVPQDYAEALRWYRLSADQGYASAQFNLGVTHANGQGVLQDYTEAVRWFRLAADQGIASAQLNLGVMYSNGQGVPQDYVEAHMWFNLAVAQSSGENRDRYVKARDAVAELMTSEQIAEAQRLTREWKPTQEP